MSKTFKIALLLSTMCSAPAIAHNVEIAGDVAGTWHVEPNENPKAGESAKIWIALTRKGGAVLPLEQANCKLAVYSQPRSEGDRPILQPQLKAIAAEQYQGIPGSDVVFPAPGLYEMELSCVPKREGDFVAFEMQSAATVAAGVARSPLAGNLVGVALVNEQGRDEQVKWRGIGGGVVIAAIFGWGLWKFLANRSMKK